MKKIIAIKMKNGIFGLLILCIFSTSLLGQTDYSLKSITGIIEGTSTLHDWKSEITKIEFNGSFKVKGNTFIPVLNTQLKILVKGIKSKEGKIMDNKTYEAFKHEKNPYIIFDFKNAKIEYDSLNNLSIESTGNLTMAGTTKSIVVNAKGKQLANGNIQFHVAKKIKMTEFDMKPPTAVLGTIHVGDEVVVKFDVLLVSKK